MNPVTQIISDAYTGYFNYMIAEITGASTPWYRNYFYGLIAISLFIWLLEIIIPWRKNQRIFRRDFWLDGFYMFFNFFLFSLIAYNALSNVAVAWVQQALRNLGIENIAFIQITGWPTWLQYAAMFVVADFIQWNTHRLLHRVPALWEFHKVHHSVKEMGFAAHLRFHWMETVIYKSLQYLPLACFGFGLTDFFMLHMMALAIGHINHANVLWTWGPLRGLINNPAMHIWHHAKHLPEQFPYGVNFGISLSIWDYIFRTAYIPSDGRDIELGFDGDEKFPTGFAGQSVYPIGQK